MVAAPRPAGARGSCCAGQRRLWSLSGIYRRVAESPGNTPRLPGATSQCTPKVNVPLLCLRSIQLIIYAQSCDN